MEPIEQLRMREKIVRELDDIHNSETAILKKIAQVEADNINLGNAALEKQLTDLFEQINTTLEAVSSLHLSFVQETEEFKKANKLEEVPDLDTL